MKKNNKFIIISNPRTGSNLLFSLINRLQDVQCKKEISSNTTIEIIQLTLDLKKHNEEELNELIRQIPPNTGIIHLQRNYPELFTSIIQNQGYKINPLATKNDSIFIKNLEKEQEDSSSSPQKFSVDQSIQIIKTLQQNDRWIDKLQYKHENFLSLDYNEIINRFHEVATFIGSTETSETLYEIKETPTLLKLAEKPLPKILNYTKIKNALKASENLRCFFQNMHSLSDNAKAAIIQTKNIDKKLPIYNKPIIKENKPSIIFIDVIPSNHFLDQYLIEESVGQNPNSVAIIFSLFNTVKELLYEKRYYSYIKNGRLKIWHNSEWEKEIKKECQKIRSPFIFNKSIIALEEHPLTNQIAKEIQKHRDTFLELAKKSRQEVETYYRSEAFSKRLKALSQGALPKIFVERACTAVAIKRFSNECAEAFKELGCETFIHEPCSGGSLDYLHANNIEINKFKPDILIKSPNYFDDKEKINIDKGPPTLYSLQDLTPHLDYLVYMMQHKQRKEDLLFYISHCFGKDFQAAGIKEEQMISDFLPTKTTPHTDHKSNQKEKYDIGFVKTMKSPFSLLERMAYREEEKELVEQIEKTLLNECQKGTSLGFFEAIKLGKKGSWYSDIFGFTHQQLSLHYINLLHEKAFSLSLAGAGWDRFPHLKPYAKGYINDRKSYYNHFFENKINLSINPWALHHPRIFEGGACGAFFLVFKVPSDQCSHGMPKELIAGEHFDYFSSDEELIEKCRYYLERPKLRKEIGQNLKEVVEKYYSYSSFCKKLIDRFKIIFTNLEKEASIQFATQNQKITKGTKIY